MEDALLTYLTQFDHRCPVCRYNITSDIETPLTYTEEVEATNHTIPNYSTSPWDMSFNFGSFTDTSSNLTPNIGSRNLTRQNSFDISFNSRNFNFDFNNDFNNAVNSAVNELSDAMVSSLTNAITNTDNSGNNVAYSLFLPSSVRRNTNNTNNT